MIGQSNEAWANGLVATLPARWCGKLLGTWERRRTSFNPAKLTAANDAQRKANEALRETVARLLPFAVNDDLTLDADDGAVVDAAWKGAERCRVRLLELVDMQQHGRAALMAAGVSAIEAEAVEAFEQRDELARLCITRGVEAPAAKYDDLPAVRRMVAARWWTGQLRKAQARALESAAIELGVVNRSRDCYVSNESLAARQAQNTRNAAALEATIAKNLETEQEFTLAELAAKGPANRAIKRAELMTRISGFERIAIARGDAGLFLTITCPSKMHSHRIIGGRAVKNPKYDHTKPKDAQKYLVGVWARIRAALARAQIGLYGFRIAEPQHDGTPHWHLLVFYPPENDKKIRAVIRRYALQMDGDEAGAQEKRCDFKTMDPGIGTAAAYIAKYVAKNIDGHRLEKDLLGNDSLDTSARVEAWASRWRIKQFQQVGGPPVGPWREMRRVESVPSDAPAHVLKAFNAVNKVATFEGRENASVAWDHYVEAQGGVFCGRNYRIRIATVASDARTAYGEAAPARPIGVEYFEVAKVRDALGNWTDILPRTVTVESRRFTWVVQSKRQNTSAITALRAMSRTPEPAFGGARAVAGGHHDIGFKGLDFGFKRAPRAPWTCVNNCTGGAENDGIGESGGVDRGAKTGDGPEGEHRKANGGRKNDGREIPATGFAAH
ncbi:replication endonuclease [Paraburkholderia dipogonis]|uniref:replication endonuclease n=1 Tax=Paraburkholderia dipogonis TaxID=1211383 RepID=UPI001FCC07DB|nr:replication endonuclease [Paraburkholderia dipogonis]